MRETGFYWVRWNGAAEVAEWNAMGEWLRTGTEIPYADGPDIEVLGPRLAPPPTSRAPAAASASS